MAESDAKTDSPKNPIEIAGEAGGAKKTPEQTAPVSPETVVHAETRADLVCLQDDVCKTKIARQEELKKMAAQQRATETWFGKSPTEPNVLIKGLLSAGIETGVNDKINEYKAKLQAFGLNEQQIDAIATAAKEFLLDYANKNNNDLGATKNYATNSLPKKFTGLFDGLSKIFDSKNFPFQNQMACLVKFNEFAGLGIFVNGNIDKHNFKNFLALDESNFNNLLTGFNEYLALEKDVTTLKAGGKIETPAAPEAQRQIGDNPAANPLANAPTNPSPALPANPNPGTINTPAETAQQQARSATIEFDTGTEAFDSILKTILDFLPKSFSASATSFLAQWGIILSAKDFEGLKDPEKSSAEEFKKAITNFGLDLATVSPIFRSTRLMRKILKLKSENTDWNGFLRAYIDGNEKARLAKKETISRKELENIFLTPVEGNPNPSDQQPDLAGQPSAAPTQVPVPAPAPAQPSPAVAQKGVAEAAQAAASKAAHGLSDADKEINRRVMSSLPQGYKYVRSVPQDVANKTNQVLAATMGSDYGIKEIIVGSDGNRYAMVRSRHDGPYGKNNEKNGPHDGVEAVLLT